MAKIILWNSIAKRRRSISDTFYDNGIATLKGYLEERKHKVEVVDWARDDFFQSLTPRPLASLLRKIYPILIDTSNHFVRNALSLLTMQLQGLMSSIQEARLQKKIREFAIYVDDSKVRIVGVKMWYGEAFVNAQYMVEQLNRIAPNVITIAGGYHDTLYEEHVLKTCNFDLGAVCEGEFPLEKILGVIDKHSQNWDKAKALAEIVEMADRGEIENIMYRKGDAICKTKRHEVKALSSKSIPRYVMDPNKVRIHVMVESLGCDWGKCNFCVHPYFYPHYSLRDPSEIIEEIKMIQQTGIGVFRFAGSDTPPAFGARIGQSILDNKLKVVFGMGSRAIRDAQNKTEALVGSYSTLIKAGLRSMFMGGECGNDFINREVMNKGVTFSDIVYSIKALREAEKRVGEKVYLSLAFIYPPPLLGKVTLDQVRDDNIRLLKETMPDSVMITPPGPFLHTKWYDEKDKFGFILDDDILTRAMKYEYVLYKPPHLWPRLGISLDGKPFDRILSECSEFRRQVEKDLEIPTDISDEHFLMFYSAGLRDQKDILKAKTDTMLDVVSCDYERTRHISYLVNEFSEQLARSNTKKTN